MMNNNFANPYMTNPYMNNPYATPMAYGSNQNRLSMLEQQKRDIENQISMLQNQQSQMPLTINNNIVPNNNSGGMQQNATYDFNGKFIKSEDELKETFNNNLPIILMSSEDSKFYIKNLDGTVTKYRFEEIKQDEEEKKNSNVEVEELKKQVNQQGIYLNQIIAMLQANNQQNNVNNTPSKNVSQIEEKTVKKESIVKPSVTTKRIATKGDNK